MGNKNKINKKGVLAIVLSAAMAVGTAVGYLGRKIFGEKEIIENPKITSVTPASPSEGRSLFVEKYSCETNEEKTEINPYKIISEETGVPIYNLKRVSPDDLGILIGQLPPYKDQYGITGSFSPYYSVYKGTDDAIWANNNEPNITESNSGENSVYIFIDTRTGKVVSAFDRFGNAVLLKPDDINQYYNYGVISNGYPVPHVEIEGNKKIQPIIAELDELNKTEKALEEQSKKYGGRVD